MDDNWTHESYQPPGPSKTQKGPTKTAGNPKSRPKKFENIPKQVVFLSATPGDYELRMCEGVMTEQLIRPTGLLEPKILIHPCKNQIDNLMTEIYKRIEKKQRVLVTTLTKKMAEKLSQYLMETGIKSTYIHNNCI